MSTVIQKLSLKEKIGYSVGDTASNLFFQTVVLFLLYFYTDVFGIPAAAVATIFLVSRVWDAVNDPLMGMIADRTTTKWGKFRPFLLWFAVPFGIIGVLTFTTPGLAPTGKLIYAFVTYTLLMMLYTIVNVPYSALMGVLSPSPQERTVVSSFRFVAAFIGQFIVQYSVLKMVRIFGGGNDAKGWQLAMTALSSLAVVLFLVTFATTRERVMPHKEQRNPLKQDLKDLFKNKPWILIGSATVFQLIYIIVRNGSIMYYFKYFVQDQQVNILGKLHNFSYEGLASVFMLSGTILTILGAILTNKISKAVGKSRSYWLFLAIAGVSTALFFFLRPQDIVMMFVLQLFVSFSVGPVSVLQWAIYTDTADYSEWKTGRRATGLVMSASLFALKLGIAVGGSILAGILALYGFEPNQDQAELALKGIRLAMSHYSAIFAIIGAAIMMFYPVTNKTLETMEEELKKMRA